MLLNNVDNTVVIHNFTLHQNMTENSRDIPLKTSLFDISHNFISVAVAHPALAVST